MIGDTTRRRPWAWVFAALAFSLAGCKTTGSTVDSGEVDEGVLGYRLAPPVGGQGTSMRVRIEATRAAFVFGETELSLGEGVAVDAVTVQDGYNALVDVTIDPDAPLGVRDAILHIESREIILADAFEVVDESFFIEPSAAKMGESVTVAFVGTNTQWEDGYTWVSFGDGVQVLDFDVLSPTLAEARVAVRPDAPPGLRDVAVESGPHVVTLFDGFTVDRAVLTAFWEPPEAYQGDRVAFTVTGIDTNFGAASAIEFWDDGGPNADIEVTEQTTIDPENMYGRIRLSNAARVGMRDVLVTTGGEQVLIPDAMNVLDAPPDLSNVYPSIGFDVERAVDNATGDIYESVIAWAFFVIPLNPPCGSPPPPGSGPMPYDNNGVFPVPPEAEPEDCPNPETVSAGDYVWYEGPENVVTMHKDVIAATGQIYYYGRDLTLDDYHFDTLYDLHGQGDPAGLPEFLVPEVQPTVPADFDVLAPQLWGDFTWSRAEALPLEWTPAQTYPDAVFSMGLSGTLVADGEPGFAAVLPWDDGVHQFTPVELSQLEAGPVSFGASSYIEGPYFGLPFSTIQTAQSDSTLSIAGSMILE